MHIPQAMVGKLGSSPHLYRAGVLRVHGPMRTVNVVSAPSGNHAGAELAAAQPTGPIISLRWVDAVNCVIHIGCFTKPHLIVEAVWNRHGRLVSAGRVSGQPNLHALQL